ncbi:MAG: RNA polymerase sigma factor [Oscillospiraceae bacterium]|jgi:RNA polymerase sigma-70 factor (ECF subfamily)|nr:RNA polymerase sigma factor [Oscillospiraceae bacterium]
MAYDISHLSYLVQQAQAGSTEAFGTLYDSLARELYRYALYFLGAPGPAEDAVQEAALSAFRSVRALRDPARLRPWFFRILANQCKRQLRQSACGGETTSLEELFGELPAADAPLGRALEVRQALAILPAGERDAVLLHVLGGFTGREIAQALGCPAGTARARLSRAMAKLRKELEEHEI